MADERQSGLGLRDVIVVILVVSLVTVLGLPAIEYARNSARKQTCTDNLSQIGMALQSYHDTYSCLPPAAFWSTAELNFNEDGRLERTKDSLKATHANWLQLLLPYLGEEQLAGTFDSSSPVTAKANQSARLQELLVASCPSDSFNRRDNTYRVDFSDGTTAEFARGNYAINGGSHVSAEYPGYLAYPITSGNVILEPNAQTDQFQWWGSGVAGFNRCFSYDDFENGLSTLAAVNEIRAGIMPEDQRGVWALGQVGSSVTWAHGVQGDAFGPNNQIRDSDDILGGKGLRRHPQNQEFFDEGMPFCDHCSLSNQATSRSMHTGGVNILMLDGRVHFVSNSVNPSLWHVLHSRETPAGTFDNEVELLLSSDNDYTQAQRQHPMQTDADSQSPEIENSVGMQFARIPAGEFMMGEPDFGNSWPFPDEAVPHKVNLTQAYYLGKHEVTQSQYQQVMGDNPSWHAKADGDAGQATSSETDRLPVENLTWYQAVEFCRRLSELPAEKASGRSYRLPTEAEWERACRGGSSESPPFNNTWDTAATTGEIAGKNRHPQGEFSKPSRVGSFPANAFGLFDMRGNVFEWCHDWFSRDYYSRSPAEDPQGPSTGYLKIVRGWDWVFVGNHCKDYITISAPCKSRFVGMRVVCDVVGDRAERPVGAE